MNNNNKHRMGLFLLMMQLEQLPPADERAAMENAVAFSHKQFYEVVVRGNVLLHCG